MLPILQYVTGLVINYIDSTNSLPVELEPIDRDSLIDLLVDQATPILRGMEDTALHTGIYQVCFMIRFAQKEEK